jgi:hypothetical protein
MVVVWYSPERKIGGIFLGGERRLARALAGSANVSGVNDLLGKNSLACPRFVQSWRFLAGDQSNRRNNPRPI